MVVALLVVGLAFALTCWRVAAIAAPIIERIADRRIAIAERLAAVEERKITLDELARRPAKKAEPMPPDLHGRIAAYEDDWAREDEERTLMTLYAEYDDWDLVRKQLRPIAAILDPQTVDQPYAEEFPR